MNFSELLPTLCSYYSHLRIDMGPTTPPAPIPCASVQPSRSLSTLFHPCTIGTMFDSSSSCQNTPFQPIQLTNPSPLQPWTVSLGDFENCVHDENLQPRVSSIPREIKFFLNPGTCRTSVNLTLLPSDIHHQNVPLPILLQAVLLAILTIHCCMPPKP